MFILWKAATTPGSYGSKLPFAGNARFCLFWRVYWDSFTIPVDLNPVDLNLHNSGHSFSKLGIKKSGVLYKHRSLRKSLHLKEMSPWFAVDRADHQWLTRKRTWDLWQQLLCFSHEASQSPLFSKDLTLFKIQSGCLWISCIVPICSLFIPYSEKEPVMSHLRKLTSRLDEY